MFFTLWHETLNLDQFDPSGVSTLVTTSFSERRSVKVIRFEKH